MADKREAHVLVRGSHSCRYANVFSSPALGANALLNQTINAALNGRLPTAGDAALALAAQQRAFLLPAKATP
jgi:hypothetical protein